MNISRYPVPSLKPLQLQRNTVNLEENWFYFQQNNTVLSLLLVSTIIRGAAEEDPFERMKHIQSQYVPNYLFLFNILVNFNQICQMLKANTTEVSTSFLDLFSQYECCWRKAAAYVQPPIATRDSSMRILGRAELQNLGTRSCLDDRESMP